MIIACFVFLGEAFAQESQAQGQAQNQYAGAAVSIAFYDRTVYYPENAADNPVLVRVTMRNTGADTLRFKLADDRMFSIDFNAYTIRNAPLAETEALVRKRTTSQTVYFREIALEAGEEYSFIENLKDYLTVASPSVYYVELAFYPELYRSPETRLTSNRLTLEVRPAPSAASSSSIPIEAQTAQIIQPEEIPPDKVVEQTIVARQRSLWDQYFLYMDIESLLDRTPSLSRRYRAASADERSRMVEQYKADLMQSRIDGDIVAIPERFQIENTSYSPTEGTVSVVEWFNNGTYSERKRYTYRLRLRAGIWQIYDYTVVNLGTE